MNSHKVYLLGHANTGKTSLYNKLTGANEKIANYHGATTRLSKKNLKGQPGVLLYDLPGTYSITGKSEDEILTVETIKNSDEDSTLLFVLDGVNLEKHIQDLAKFLKPFANKKHRVVLALNMYDEILLNKIDIDLEHIKSQLEVPVLFTSAKKKHGLKELRQILCEHKNQGVNLLDFSKKLDSLKDYVFFSERLTYKRMHSIDRVALSPLWGGLIFLLVMLTLFQAVFSWASPFMDLIENGIAQISEGLSPFLTNSYAQSFVNDALLGGLGAFLVFTPQIFFLKMIISILEESGYLSRASIICHRALSFFGLSGESFIPLLTSHACAIPGIYAAKHIRSKKIRLLTIFSLPLTLCSARLPVYALLITFLVPNTLYLGGLLGLRGFALFSLYLLGLILTLMVSKVLSLSLYKKNSQAHFVIELPRYQIPDLIEASKQSFKTTYAFIRDAGLIIFLTNCFIWFLATFPNGPGNLNSSYLSSLGSLLMPLSRPIGMGWPETIALLTSFLARETFVSTLGTLYGSNSESMLSLSQVITSTNGGYSLASTLSLIIFFAVALQCVSTLAVLKKEIPNRFGVFYLFSAYLFLAYALSFIVYNLTSILT